MHCLNPLQASPGTLSPTLSDTVVLTASLELVAGPSLQLSHMCPSGWYLAVPFSPRGFPWVSVSPDSACVFPVPSVHPHSPEVTSSPPVCCADPGVARQEAGQQVGPGLLHLLPGVCSTAPKASLATLVPLPAKPSPLPMLLHVPRAWRTRPDLSNILLLWPPGLLHPAPSYGPQSSQQSVSLDREVPPVGP